MPHEFDFVATGTSATITFSSFGLNAGGYDVGLDNVTISATSAIPEPGTLSLLAGFGLVGLASALRRRRSNRRR